MQEMTRIIHYVFITLKYAREACRWVELSQGRVG